MTAQLGAGHPLTQQKRFSLVLNLQATNPDPALDAELEALIDARRASGGIQFFSMLSNYLDELNARRQFARARVCAAEVLRLRDEIGIAADHPFRGSAAAEPGLEAELDRFVQDEKQSYYRAMALAAKAKLQLARRDCAAVRQTLAVFESTGDPASRLMESRHFRGECALIEGRPDEARSAFEELVQADQAQPQLGRMIGARAQVQLGRLLAATEPERAQALLQQGLARLRRYLPADDPWWRELGLRATPD
jgi:tetratricopeptide (TPR) repeat protein